MPGHEGHPPPTVNLQPLTGQRVRLRALREEDLPELCAWWSDTEVAAYVVGTAPSPRPADELAEMFVAWSKNDGASCGLCIVTNDDQATLVGHTAVYGASLPHLCATFAIILGPAFHGRGYGSEATRLIVDFGFAELGLHRVELGVFDFNPRAIATYEKVGFVREGIRREAAYRSGRWHDDISMAIIRSDWEAARSSLDD